MWSRKFKIYSACSSSATDLIEANMHVWLPATQYLSPNPNPQVPPNVTEWQSKTVQFTSATRSIVNYKFFPYISTCKLLAINSKFLSPQEFNCLKKTASSIPTKPTLRRLLANSRIKKKQTNHFTYTGNFITLQVPESCVIYQDLGFKDMVTIQDPSSEVALPVLKNRFWGAAERYWT